ncbi:2OG-Fe(II) oxygenase [Ruegeria sp. ANG-R]|uniref:2OG-Fe(II) oxygenase n=1 Tax=Ruegeria sp. ANG-R TaxID=1577903 RepID=UPI0009E2A9CE|nr:2OG-Fe(II) oxygenase [Ruegeria sp. ANG-R]
MLKRKFAVPEQSVYSSARPFPHAVMKDIWSEEKLDEVRDAVENNTNWDGEKSFYGSVGKRWCSTWWKLPRPVVDMIQVASQPPFLRMLEKMTGETGLIPDPYLKGGGIHSTAGDGFLKMHADFNWHGEMQLYRRLNLLVYLNRDWDENWGGNLDLARRDASGNLNVEASVYPHFNTTVVFTTDDTSFHGQPDPMTLPEGVARNSIALYYYVAEKPQSLGERRSGTDYRNLAGSKLNRRNPN